MSGLYKRKLSRQKLMCKDTQGKYSILHNKTVLQAPCTAKMNKLCARDCTEHKRESSLNRSKADRKGWRDGIDASVGTSHNDVSVVDTVRDIHGASLDDCQTNCNKAQDLIHSQSTTISNSTGSIHNRTGADSGHGHGTYVKLAHFHIGDCELDNVELAENIADGHYDNPDTRNNREPPYNQELCEEKINPEHSSSSLYTDTNEHSKGRDMDRTGSTTAVREAGIGHYARTRTPCLSVGTMTGINVGTMTGLNVGTMTGLNVGTMTGRWHSKCQPLLQLDPGISDSDSVLSTDVNTYEYFQKLKEFEEELHPRYETDAEERRRRLRDNQNQRDYLQTRPPGKCGSNASMTELNLSRSVSEEGISGLLHDKQRLIPGGRNTRSRNHRTTRNRDRFANSLDDVIKDFLNYFQLKRVSLQRKAGEPGGRAGVMSGREDAAQSMAGLKDTDKTDASCGRDTDVPSPPPRRNRATVTRGHDVTPTNGTVPHKAVTRDMNFAVDDNTRRSPSVRKRDAMQMRRYNSTSTLPVTSPIMDVNRNPLSGSSQNLTYTGSGTGNWSDVYTGHDVNYISNNNITQEYSTQHLDQVDIVGESFEARFPWQRDISTQCNLPGLRHSVSSSGSGGSGSDGSYHVTNCNRYVNDERNNPSQQASDSVRRRHNAFKNRRPRSMTSFESNLQRSNVYRSDTNINYSSKHVRTSSDSSPMNRKRMPILLSDDPGSVSDLESIMENPNDSVFGNQRTRSLGSETSDISEISTNLRHLENARDGGQLDVPASQLVSDVDAHYAYVLPSPRVSPEMWRNVPDVVVNTERGNSETSSERQLSNSKNGNLLSVPRKTTRRLSSGSINSGSDESDADISPPVARRGRRAAIIDTKNFGDVSPTTLSPEVSPSNSCDEGDNGSNIAGRLRRRRSSLDVAMNVYPGDLLVQEHHKKLIKRNTISDFYSGRNGSTSTISEESKKQRQSFSLLKLMKARSKESLHLTDVLKALTPSEFKDNHLAAYKNIHWTDLIASTDKQSSVHESLNITEVERKRRESVWELFKSECVFLIDHLMVLKHCFQEPLKKVQVEGFLMYTEPSEIFSNIDELCYVSYTFCKDFIAALLKDMSSTDFGSTTVLIQAFQRFSNHSKDGSVYHTYCLNYNNALSYLEKLRKNDDFCEFEKWCEQDQRCNRLQLVDLLIGPMQHCTKLPLLLHNIQKYTEDPVDKAQIVQSIEKLEISLRHLEEKMKWLKNFERVQEIQRRLVWPTVSDLDSRAFIPEYLRGKLSRQPCERLLACPSRQLIHEGAVTLTESTKSFDSYLFLFDDILLITKTKKPNRKKQSSIDVLSSSAQPDNQTYCVHRQPIALDRLGIHDVPHTEATANGLKYAFVIVQISRFQQIIDVFTLQASTEALKSSWISQILDAKNACLSRCHSRGNSLKDEDQQNATARKSRHGKSLSIDAVFL